MDGFARDSPAIVTKIHRRLLTIMVAIFGGFKAGFSGRGKFYYCPEKVARRKSAAHHEWKKGRSQPSGENALAMLELLKTKPKGKPKTR